MKIGRVNTNIPTTGAAETVRISKLAAIAAFSCHL